MGYVVAIDPTRRDGWQLQERPSARTPSHAFVVDGSNKVVWHGLPGLGLEKAIDKALASKVTRLDHRNPSQSVSVSKRYRIACPKHVCCYRTCFGGT
jgi:hypothetical protein